MLSITQLEYIVALDQFRHFGNAAKACHITQPTLSMQLNKAEEFLGLILFDRSKNPMLPTIEGVAIIQQARIVLREYKKIAELKDMQKESVAGTLKLGVIPTLAPYLIPLFVGPFAKKYPHVKLIIEEYKTEDMLRLIHSDELDVGLLVTPVHDEQMIERVLFNETFYVFASKDDPLLKKVKIKNQDLRKDGIWLLNEGHCFRSQVFQVCGINGENEVYSNLRFQSGNLETLINIVSNNEGYTLLPHLAVMNLPSEDKKFVREFTSPIPSREVSLVHNRIFLKEKMIAALEEEIIASLPKEISSLKKSISTIPIM